MNKIDHYAKVIWDYMLLHQEPEKADAIFVLGSGDIRVADRSVELYKKDLATLVICSGGYGGDTFFTEPEAETFSKRMIELGVPKERIILEKDSKNTGENVLFTKKLLEEKSIPVTKVIAVQKPYMERRTFATIKKQWPEIQFIVTSPQISYEEYSINPDFKKWFLDTMVGDLLRLREYPKLGFQIEQKIPEEVWQAGQELLKMGYDKYKL